MRYITGAFLALHITLTAFFTLSYGAVCTEAELCILISIILTALAKPDLLIYCIFFLIPFTGNNPGNDFIPLLIIISLFSGFTSIPFLIRSHKKTLLNIANLLFLIFTALVSFLSIIISSFSHVFHKSLQGIISYPGMILFAQENSELYPLSLMMLFYSSACIYFYTVNIIKNRRIETIIRHFIIISSLLVMLGLIKYYTHIDLPLFYESNYSYLNIPRLSAFFANPGWYGQFLLFILFPSIFFIIKGKSLFHRIFFSISALCIILSLVLTIARAAYISFLAVTLLMLASFSCRHLRKKGHLYRTALIFIVLIILSASAFYIYENIDIKAHLSNNPRLYLYRYAVKIFLDNPVKGCGIGKYAVNARQLFTEDTPMIVKYYHSTAHNTYLNILAEGGLLLFLPFTILLALAVFKRSVSLFSMMIKASLVSIIFIALFQHIFYISVIGLFFIIYIAISANYGDYYE